MSAVKEGLPCYPGLPLLAIVLRVSTNVYGFTSTSGWVNRGWGWVGEEGNDNTILSSALRFPKEHFAFLCFMLSIQIT
jgi:hypothetical protein